MPLIASQCPGSFHEFEHSLADEEERQITRALWQLSENEIQGEKRWRSGTFERTRCCQ